MSKPDTTPPTRALANDNYIQSLLSYKNHLEILGYHSETVKNKGFYLKHFLLYLEEQSITAIALVKPKEVKAYHEKLKQKKNIRTSKKLTEENTNYQIRNLQQYFDYLVQEKKLSYNPASGIALRTPKNTKERFVFSQLEIKELYLKTETSEEIAMLHLAYGCGLRVGELIQLNIEDVNLEDQLVTVVKGKNNKRRLIPINDKITEDLQNYLEERSALFNQDRLCLFLNIAGNRMRANGFRLRLKRLLARTVFGKTRAQNQKIGMHTLRHSIASHFLENGMAMEQIQTFLGHQHLDTTETYTHVSKKALQRLNTGECFV